MKKLLMLVLLCSAPAMAVEPTIVNKSSFIAAANHSGYIASSYLDKVVIGLANSGGILELYNSTYTTNVLISSMSTGTVGDRDFDDTKVRGIYYRVSSNTNGVTIIYK